jgi:hypothetical protein
MGGLLLKAFRSEERKEQEVQMDGSVMRKLADALGDVGFVIKRIEEEAYGSYERPPGGEKYTGEIIIKIRPAKDEEADVEKLRARKEKEKAGDRPTASESEISF